MGGEGAVLGPCAVAHVGDAQLQGPEVLLAADDAGADDSAVERVGGVVDRRAGSQHGEERDQLVACRIEKLGPQFVVDKDLLH